jgi:hypothetical protein
MACSSCAQRSAARAAARAASLAGPAVAPEPPPTRTLYQVVLNGGEGRTVYQSHNLDLARGVQSRYPNSVLSPDPDAPAVTAEAVVEEPVKKTSRKTAPAADAEATDGPDAD